MKVVPSALLLAAAMAFPARAEKMAMTPLTPMATDEMARQRTSSAYIERNENRRWPPRVSADSWFLAKPAPTDFATTTPPPKATGFVGAAGTLPPADATGAVSAHFVVGVTNQSVVIEDRTGKLLSNVFLSQFWTDPALPPAILTDPRILYDATNDRWIVITLYDGASSGKLLVAFTATGDPTGTWKRFSSPYNNTDSATGDFPIVGQNADSILITTNDYNTTDCYLFVMPKSYAAIPTLERYLHNIFDLVPVTASDSSRKFISSSGSVLFVYDLVNGVLTTSQTYTASISPQFSSTPACGLQLGFSHPIDCGVDDVEYAVQRNGVTWAVGFTGRGAMAWRISGTAAKAYLLEAPDAVFAYPSIAVNRAGAALIGYSVFSPTAYVAGGYSYIDPAGNLSASAILKPGEATYLGGSRWGDYTTAMVDPADDLSFWTVQLYALNRTTWSTWWGYVKVTAAEPARGRAVRH